MFLLFQRLFMCSETAGISICFIHKSYTFCFSIPLVPIIILALFTYIVITKLKNRHRSNGNNVDKKDLISELSDDVLILILARMNTSSATRTSVLSTRWRNLHKSVPLVDLNCYDLLVRAPIGFRVIRSNILSSLHKFACKLDWNCAYYLFESHHDSGPDSVLDSFDRLLSTLHPRSTIRSFRLSCCLNWAIKERFQLCFYSLGRLGVERLVLECSCRCLPMTNVYKARHTISFPCHLLSVIPSLKYFKLSYCYLVGTSLRTQWSSLQILVLTDVRLYSPGALRCILSTCSSLDALTIRKCIFESIPKLIFRGASLKLKSLYIYEMDASSSVNEIEFYASNLEVFEFTSYKVVNFRFDHVPQLHSVYLYTFGNDILQHYVGPKLAKDLPHLKSLSFVTTNDWFQGSNSKQAVVYRFGNLRRLDLTLKPRNRGRIDLLLLTVFLQVCPILQEFHLRTFLSERGRPQGVKQGIVLHSELKKMEISGFVGTENDIEFALYVLKSAIKLEKMHITKCTKVCKEFGRSNRIHRKAPWSKKRREMILTRLQGQAVSRTAELIIEHKAQEDYKLTPIEEYHIAVSKTAQLFFQHKHQIISAIEEDCDDYA